MLKLYESSRLELLIEPLLSIVREPPADAFSPEWIAVPNAGMQRWLRLELARHLGANGGNEDGVTANIQWEYPGSLRAILLASATTDDPLRGDPWSIDRLVWRILKVLQEENIAQRCPDLPLLPEGMTRYQRARHLADLYDRYDLHSPEMVRAWTSGEDVGPDGEKLSTDERWQAQLFRIVHSEIGEPCPAERLPELFARVREGSLGLALPQRLEIFGLSTLPGGSSFLELAEVVATQHNLSLFFLDPSPTAQRRVRTHAPKRFAGTRLLRRDDISHSYVEHPLVRSWSQPARERALLLGELEHTPKYFEALDERPPRHLLAALQEAILRDRPAESGVTPDAADGSLNVHVCHGIARQAEVMRDAILHRLQDDPTLSEEEIIILCPDLATALPAIELAFGPSAPASPGEETDATHQAVAAGRTVNLSRMVAPFRYQIADRSLQMTNPLLEALVALLQLLSGRGTASEVSQFLSLEPVRQRWELGEEDLDTIDRWMREARVRWGLTSEHRRDREPLLVGSRNTWAEMVDRLLAGVVISSTPGSLMVDEVAPIAVDGDEIDLAAAVAGVLALLERLRREAKSERSISQWCDFVKGATAQLFLASPNATWQQERLNEMLLQLMESQVDQDSTPATIGLADLRRVIEERIRAIVGRADFFRGGITVTSLVPLSWVPFRVVGILGLDEGALATSSSIGDDLLAREAHIGDRDTRAEVRQALLESLLNAEDAVIITRNGRDERTNAEVFPATVYIELRDAIVALMGPQGSALFTRWVQHIHPYQSFDRANFVADERSGAPAWSFDFEALLAGDLGAPAKTKAIADAPLLSPPADLLPVPLGRLQQFLTRPVRTFLTDRLGVASHFAESPHDDVLSIEIDPLDRSTVGRRLLEIVRSGHSLEEALRSEAQRGIVPLGRVGEIGLRQIAEEIELFIEAEAALAINSARELSIASEFTTEIAGVLSVCNYLDPKTSQALQGTLSVDFQRAKSTLALTGALSVALLTIGQPEVQWTASSLRRGRSKSGLPDVPEWQRISVRGEDLASRAKNSRQILQHLLTLYRWGMCQALPLFPDLSAALAQGEGKSGDWIIDRSYGDGLDDATLFAFGELSFSELLALPLRGDEPQEVRTLLLKNEPVLARRNSRVVAWARQLWNPITELVHVVN